MKENYNPEIPSDLQSYFFSGLDKRYKDLENLYIFSKSKELKETVLPLIKNIFQLKIEELYEKIKKEDIPREKQEVYLKEINKLFQTLDKLINFLKAALTPTAEELSKEFSSNNKRIAVYLAKELPKDFEGKAVSELKILNISLFRLYQKALEFFIKAKMAEEYKEFQQFFELCTEYIKLVIDKFSQNQPKNVESASTEFNKLVSFLTIFAYIYKKGTGKDILSEVFHT